MADKTALAEKTKDRYQQVSNNGGHTVVNNQIVEQVRQLAWTGQHAKAIDLATETLSPPKIKHSEQMDLLDLRAESYIAQGQLDLAAKDAKEMAKLAASPAQKAQTLNRRSLAGRHHAQQPCLSPRPKSTKGAIERDAGLLDRAPHLQRCISGNARCDSIRHQRHLAHQGGIVAARTTHDGDDVVEPVLAHALPVNSDHGHLDFAAVKRRLR